MKKIGILVLVGITLMELYVTPIEARAGAASESEFIELYKQAHLQNNVEMFMRLVYMNGVTEEIAEKIKKMASEDFKDKLASARITPKRENQITEYIRDGIIYRSNLKVIGNLEIKYEGNSRISYLPIGIKNGVYYFPATVPAGKSKTLIKGTPMLDVISYGYQVSVFINGTRIYSGKDASYSGIIPKGIKKGLNRLNVKYQQISNPRLKKLEVKVRLMEKNKNKILLNWRAPNPSGAVSLNFTF
ncbi:MAG: hypothetical protein HY776_06450 [Actinobacteria bacterium]|nr:hypothetical protein [Actinomycetota bacterium]